MLNCISISSISALIFSRVFVNTSYCDGVDKPFSISWLSEYDFLSLVKLNLETGRTHQIRVHLSNIDHPVFGDETYGGREPRSVNLTSKMKAQIKNLLELIPRQALHAKVIGFTHPHSDKGLRFESELPADMKNILLKINTK